jgi:hypothetical protein
VAIPKRKENRGGARPGAGAKKQTKSWSSDIKRDVLRHVKAMAKETGMTFGAVLAHMCWDPNERVQSAVRLGAAKLISEILVIRESHKTVEKVQGPTIGLPQIKRRDDGQQEIKGKEEEGTKRDQGQEGLRLH